MKKKLIGIMMLTLILSSTLGMVFITTSYAKVYENNGLNEDFIEKMSKSQLTSEAEQEQVSSSSSEIPRTSADKWNFNDTNKWSKFVYINNDKTRLIIGVDPDKPEIITKLKEIASEHQAEIVNTVTFGNQIRAVIVELSMTMVTTFAEEVRNMRLATYIEPNMKVQVQFVPNDPYWSVQWGPQKIEAEWAWNVTVGSSTVLVAVVDTGIDYNHPDLAANYASLGYDWANLDTDPRDDYGHGTHCAGIIAAVLNNSIGIAGLAQVQIMSEKVLDSGGYGYWDWVANGITHAVDQGANIISMSLGGYGDSQLVHDAVKYAYDAGVLVIAAAGNDNTNTKSYPAGYDEVIAVAATDQTDNKAWFSNWGDWIELSAPGVSIYSTMPTYHVTLNNYGYAMNYDYLSGTSMACPHVAGLAALLWSLYPQKTKDWFRLWLRFTADDLGESGFDVYYGYGRINARKTIERTPPEHELIAYEWTTPPYVKPETVGTVNATVLNFGENNETDVTVQLLANDTIVDSTVIDFLACGNSTTVSLQWNPIIEGQYNVTLYVLPAPDETILENNVLSKSIYVGIPVKAVVLHSAGNILSNIITNWQVLNNEWNRFGDTMIYIDYTSLNKENIVYEDIVAAEADVLFISCAYDPYMGWQFTDSEIEAIKRYVHEGHGLIVTAGTLYSGVPNNNKLAPLFGVNETIRWEATGTDLLHLLNVTHPIFRNVPNPFVFAYCGTAIPFDWRWDQNELAGGKYLALGHYQEGAIVAFRGLMYISSWLEAIPPYYHHNLQLLYNAITWSQYQRPQHDLVVSLECPIHIDPGESALVNATVINAGLNEETNVNLILHINGTEVGNLNVPTLAVDDSATISYLWTPALGTYNVTAYAPPVPGEEDALNNLKTMQPRVSYAAVIGFVETHGESLHSDELKGFYQSLGHIVVTIHSSLTRELLADYDIIIVGEDWSDIPWSSSETAAVRDFIQSGKGFVGIGDELAFSAQEIFREYGISYTGYSGYYGSSRNFDHSHPLMSSVGSIYSSAPVNSLRTVPPAYWIANDALNISMLIAGANVRGIVLWMSDDFGYGLYSDDNEVMFENLVNWMAVKYEHDLAVSLEASPYLEMGTSCLLNATVRNNGLNNEIDVELYLLINDTVVSSVIIDELLVTESYTMTSLWTPTETGNYNITVYASPLHEEGHVANNVLTQLVRVFYYRRVYLPHEWVGGGVSMGWHADDSSWEYTLPFNFPFYGIYYKTVYISSNGLIAFLGPDSSLGNSIPALSGKMAIAPAWDDWVTYEPYDIFIWQNSTHVGIRWYVAAYYNRNIIANFEAILTSDGVIQFNYESNNGPISATAGISSGFGHIIAEDLSDLNNINTIVFLPFPVDRNVAVISVEPETNEVTAGDLVDIEVVVENRGNYTENFTVTAYALYQENSTSDSSPSLTNTRVFVDPSERKFTTEFVSVGYKFNVTIRVEDVQDLFTWQVGMHYDGSIINATRWLEPTWDPEYVFYGQNPVSPPPVFERGLVIGGASLISGQESFNGSGKLCIIEFEIIAIPPEQGTYSCSLHINNIDTFLLDSHSWDIVASIEDGYYELRSTLALQKYIIETLTVEGLQPGERLTLTFIWNTTDVLSGDYLIYAEASHVPYEIIIEDNICENGIITVNPSEITIHDIAVSDVVIPLNVAYQGWVLEINVTVENIGNGTETFTVTLYYNDTLMEMQSIPSLDPNATLTLSFYWNTTYIPFQHNYTIRAVASIVSGEIDTDNNILTDGLIEIRRMGDINGDGVVNMRDIGESCLAFGACPGRSNWNLLADLNRDGRVDLRDIGMVCCNFNNGKP